MNEFEESKQLAKSFVPLLVARAKPALDSMGFHPVKLSNTIGVFPRLPLPVRAPSVPLAPVVAPLPASRWRRILGRIKTFLS